MRLTIFILLIFLFACSAEKVHPLKADENLKVIASQESWNSVLNFSDEGALQAKLYAEHILKFDRTREIILEKISVQFFNEKGIHESTLTADRGRVDENTKNMFAYGNVVAKNDSGVVLKTDELMWRSEDKKIASDKFVTITSKTESIQGYGFESDQKIKNYRVFTPVINTEMKENK